MMTRKEPKHKDLETVDVSAWKDRLEIASKLMIGIFVTAYVAGLLILNFHVRHFGVSYLNFLQIEYVLAGSLWFFLIAANYVWAMFIWHWIKWIYDVDTIKNNKWLSGTIKALVGVPVIGGLYFSFTNFFILILSESSIDLFSEDALLSSAVIFANMFATWAVARSARKIFTNARLDTSGDSKLRQLLWEERYALFTAVVGMSIMLSWYSKFLYPKLSPSVGGGRSQTAEILITKEGRETAVALGFRFLEESQNIGKQQIIFETPDFFLVYPPEGHNKQVKAIRIRKDIVDAVFYLSDGNKTFF